MPLNLNVALVRARLERLVPHIPTGENPHGQLVLITGAIGFFVQWLLALIDSLSENEEGIQVTAVSRSPGVADLQVWTPLHVAAKTTVQWAVCRGFEHGVEVRDGC